MTPMESLRQHVQQHPYPLLFVTLSGAHLYGFPSADSDFDLRGAHILPLAEAVGLQTGPETIETLGNHGGRHIDFVTHEVKKFFGLLLKRNGYVLEQVFSPLVVHTTPEHDALKEIAKECITRNHGYHYLAFADNQWKLVEKRPRVKALLYMYRVLLTGIHLMHTGEVEANLLRLTAATKLSQLDDLIQRKIAGEEEQLVSAAELEFHRGEYTRLRDQLQEAQRKSALPESPRARGALHDLLVKLRLSAKPY